MNDSDPIWLIQKEIIFGSRGVVYADTLSELRSCTHLLQLQLPVWGKITLAAHARHSFPPTLSSSNAGALCIAELVA